MRTSPLLLCGFAAAIAPACTGPDGPGVGGDRADELGVVLPNGDFELPEYDSGPQNDTCFVATPWGDATFGLEAATFTDPTDRSFGEARFIASGHNVFMHGNETRGEFGFVRVIQGDQWGSSNCDPGNTPWNVFEPQPTSGRNLELSFDLQRTVEDTRPFSLPYSWVMFAVNVWFDSPLIDKPLVMDLHVSHDCTLPFCRARSNESDEAYHYMEKISDDEPPLGEWHSFAVALAPHIAAAAQKFDLTDEVADSLTVTQIEFVIELKNAEGAGFIDNFVLTDVSE